MKLLLQTAASLALCVALCVLTFCGDLIREIEESPLAVMAYEDITESSREESASSDGGSRPSSSSDLTESDSDQSSADSSDSEEEDVHSNPGFETTPPVSLPVPESPPESEPVEPPSPPSSSEPSSAPSSSEPSSTSSGPPAVEIDPDAEESASGSDSSLPSQVESSSSAPNSSEPSSTPSSASSSTPSSTPSSAPSSVPSEPSSSDSSVSDEQVWVTMNGKTSYMNAYDAICMVAEAEVGHSFHKEAIKAQAVAAYTYIKYYNAAGSPASVPGKTPHSITKEAVAEVFGQAVYYGGKYAFTPYSACSAGKTSASSEVWGGYFSYLVSVDSAYDPIAAHKDVVSVYTRDQIKALLEDYTGLLLDDSHPENWLVIDSTAAGGYVLKVTVTGLNGTKQLTGRQIRENLLSYQLKSHAFTVSYADGAFTFVTNGYGHGVGLSQTGANGYAINEGWSYVDILTHYYPGTSVY